MRKLFNDEVGFVISAELVLVMTIAVLAMVVGLASVRDAITAELVDISNAFGTVDQSFNYRGLSKPSANADGKAHGSAAGAGFADREDDCDCKGLMYTDVCGKIQSTGGNREDGTAL